MEDIRKQRFLTIETKTESNLEEMQQKIRQHRKKIAIREIGRASCRDRG